MGLRKVRLGELIELVDERNVDGITDIRGLNKDKVFMPTVANTDGLDVSKYKVVKKGRFAFSGMQTGRDVCIRISLNDDSTPFVISPAYQTFKVVDENQLVPEYLFMYFKSPEKDRLGWFYSDGSIRSNLDWDVFCDIELPLPPLEVQRKYVAVYEAMLANQRSYERGLEDLKLVAISMIEDLRRNMPLRPIGDYITPVNEKNTDGSITLEQGVNIQKKFITPQRANSNLTGRKIVRTGQFAYCTQLNNSNVAIAYREGPDCVVSSVYDVFEITKRQELDPDYLFLWLIRDEFGRFVYWASEGSAYEFLNYNNLADYQIPVPSMEVQHSIADIYRVYWQRKELNERLKAQLKDLCPILIKGAIDEARAS